MYTGSIVCASIGGGILPFKSVTEMYWKTVLKDLPIMFVISFIAAFFITKLAIAVAKKSLGIPTLATEESPQNH